MRTVQIPANLPFVTLRKVWRKSNDAQTETDYIYSLLYMQTQGSWDVESELQQAGN